jgi:hypothetical protein
MVVIIPLFLAITNNPKEPIILIWFIYGINYRYSEERIGNKILTKYKNNMLRKNLIESLKFNFFSNTNRDCDI